MGMTYDAGKASQRERRGTLAEIRSGIKSGAETKAAHASGKRLRGGKREGCKIDYLRLRAKKISLASFQLFRFFYSSSFSFRAVPL